MIRIKRMGTHTIAAQGFTLCAGSAHIKVRPGDVCDLDPKEEEFLLTEVDPPVFEYATDAHAENADRIITQEDLDGARMVYKEFHSRVPVTNDTQMAKARELALSKYGSIEEVPEQLRNALKMGTPDEIVDLSELPRPQRTKKARRGANPNNALSEDELASLRGN